MKLNLTGYKNMAPPNAKRVDLSLTHDATALLDPYYPIRPPEGLVKQLQDFIEFSKGEHQAIYFWMSHA